MASSKEYLNFILEQLSDLEEITYRSMMGEYIVYYRGKIVGGIYDDRAKEMLLVDEVDNKDFLTGLFNSMYDELPAPKPKKNK